MHSSLIPDMAQLVHEIGAQVLLDGTGIPAIYDGAMLEKTYTYTDKGHLKSINTIFNNPKKDLKTEYHILEKKYEYDVHNNWTKCEIYVDGILNDTVFREIEYWQ